jgi:EpsI family protein
MVPRILILIVSFLAASAYIAQASKTEPVTMRDPLARVPTLIDQWRGYDVPIDDEVLAVLGVDDYLNRTYVSNSDWASTYVGFYQTQRQGSSIHSPMNCLPGAGWNPVSRSYLTVPVSPEPNSTTKQDIRINRIVIEKGMERQLAFYWYQAHGRVVASEYWGKAYTVLDAMRLNRTDGAIIRVICPILGPGPYAEQDAEKLGVGFIQLMYPLLSRSLPE